MHHSAGRFPRLLLHALPFLASAPPLLHADVLVLKDGNKIEGAVTDKGTAYDVKTKYGTLTVQKAEVVEFVKDPSQMAAEADRLLKQGHAMVEEAAKIDDNPKERNRRLNAAIDPLNQALRLYTKARDLFSGPEYASLDEGITQATKEMRDCRFKMAREEEKPAAKPEAKAAAPAPEARAPEFPKPEAKPEAKTPEPEAKAAAPKPEGTDGGLSFADPVKPAAARAEKPAAPGGAPSANPAGPAAAPAAKTTEAPKPEAKTAADFVAALAGTDPKLRLDAIRHLGASPASEAVTPLSEILKRETGAEALAALGDALGAQDVALLAKQAALKDAAAAGSDAQKRAVVAAFKKAGTEPGVRFLVENFVAKGDVSVRNETASALKKHKKFAAKPLKECLGKSANRPDIQVDVIKYMGIIGESKLCAPFLVSLLESKDVSNTVLHALRKIDRPGVPALIQFGLGGPSRTRMLSGWLLRGLTGQNISSQNSAEWLRWYQINRKGIEAKEAEWDKADEACDWAVDALDWSEYDEQIVDNYWYTGYYWRWQSSRERPRGAAGGGGFRGGNGFLPGGGAPTVNNP